MNSVNSVNKMNIVGMGNSVNRSPEEHRVSLPLSLFILFMGGGVCARAWGALISQLSSNHQLESTTCACGMLTKLAGQPGLFPRYGQKA